MKIVVDDKIPFIREAIAQISDHVIYKPGIQINANDVRDADALIVRTRTRCDASLLKNSKVSFIATATIGFDHLDTAFLKQAHIEWSNCPGCNAGSVAQYIHSCLLLLEQEKGYDLTKTTIGLVGFGHVGQAVAHAIRPLGVRILFNDPPLQEMMQQEGMTSDVRFSEIEELQAECDIISFHTPLIMEGPHPTYHLADGKFFNQLREKAIIINTSRGAVIDNEHLLLALKSGRIQDAIIDTWENEPNINRELLKLIYIGTPHIAGYSADGKANATRMALTALCNHFHIPATFQIDVPRLPKEEFPEECLSEKEWALKLYNPCKDSLKLKSNPELFEEIRGNYPLRREIWE